MKTLTLAMIGTVMLASSGLAQAEILTLKAEMTAAKEVPPAADSKASGSATFTIDTETKKITWETTSRDLTGAATAAHIHGPAAEGENAGPLIDMSANIERGSADLTDAQLADVQAGRTYVNIHTEKYPDGEIRGQLLR